MEGIRGLACGVIVSDKLRSCEVDLDRCFVVVRPRLAFELLRRFGLLGSASSSVTASLRGIGLGGQHDDSIATQSLLRFSGRSPPIVSNSSSHFIIWSLGCCLAHATPRAVVMLWRVLGTCFCSSLGR